VCSVHCLQSIFALPLTNLAVAVTFAALNCHNRVADACYRSHVLYVSRFLLSSTSCISGPCSVVGIATSYGLDGPGIESRWGARFSAPVQTGPGAHPASCTMGTGSFPGGKGRPGRDADPSPPSSAVGHERVEVYLYSPYGPYGLYRASVPVQG